MYGVYNSIMKKSTAVNRNIVSILVIWVFTALVLLTCCPATASSESIHSSSVTDCVNRALNYLRGRQQPDGGFAEPGASSSEHLTTYVIPAIAAAGEDPKLWTEAGNSPIDFLKTQMGSWTKLTDVERACLALASAGVEPRDFNGRNLVAEINANIASDGHIGDSISEHIWGVIALKAANESLPSGSLAWLKSVQNTDGGFSFSAGSGSDPDDTGSALQAMIISGAAPDDASVDRAVKYLAYCQADDGGFKWNADFSNTASTAWAIQGIAASGRDAGSSDWQTSSGKTPIQYLMDSQQPDGHIKYTSTSDSKPAWMTAESIPALMKRPYPLNYTPAPLDDESEDSDSDSGEESSRTNDSTTSSSDDETSDTVAESSLSTDNDSDSRSSGTGGGTTVSPSVENDGYTASNGTAAASAGKSPGSGPRSLNLPAFIVFCATYFAVLGLSFLGSYLYVKGTRKENLYGL